MNILWLIRKKHGYLFLIVRNMFTKTMLEINIKENYAWSRNFGDILCIHFTSFNRTKMTPCRQNLAMTYFIRFKFNGQSFTSTTLKIFIKIS